MISSFDFEFGPDLPVFLGVLRSQYDELNGPNFRVFCRTPPYSFVDVVENLKTIGMSEKEILKMMPSLAGILPELTNSRLEQLHMLLKTRFKIDSDENLRNIYLMAPALTPFFIGRIHFCITNLGI